jgi:hypothetical protein
VLRDPQADHGAAGQSDGARIRPGASVTECRAARSEGVVSASHSTAGLIALTFGGRVSETHSNQNPVHQRRRKLRLLSGSAER